MSDQNTAATPPARHEIRIIALMEPDQATPNGTLATGFLIGSADSATLSRTLQAICDGTSAAPPSARRVRITVHEEGVMEEERALSPREQQVLCGLVRGLSYKMIADELDIGFETVRSHIKGIYLKLNVNNNTAAVAKAIHAGLAAA
ncbi:MAG: response regulator transcription factor [Flavobacteriia bacterium]|nr:response regulator transcription factor [Flavobacteriia bacterium]